MKVLEIRASVLGLDSSGKAKHVACHVTDPGVCASILSAIEGYGLELEKLPDSHMAVLEPKKQASGKSESGEFTPAKNAGTAGRGAKSSDPKNWTPAKKKA